MKIVPDSFNISETERKNLVEQVGQFTKMFQPLEEGAEYIFVDMRTNALFYECHIKASKIVEFTTVDVPLDPENQAEYRANRDLVEDHEAYTTMKQDALRGRVFSNLVAEYNIKYNKNLPLKIIGGQHRYIAIKESHEKGINEYHGVKVYFLLDTPQRLDVQLISNTNIAVAGDLLDRMYETVKGPELRLWCQKVGLLENNCDFADKKQRGSAIAVRGARSFILSFFEGRKYNSTEFEKIKPEPIIAKTGGIDEQWDSLRTSNPGIWDNTELAEAGKKYSELNCAQSTYILSHNGRTEYAEKALNYAILSSWAFVAGLLQTNKTRLDRHYALASKSSTDPLNASALSKAKHKTDPQNYRGLGTRTDMKERGRLVELFYSQTERGEGITTALTDYAMKSYHAKLAFLEADEAKGKI